MRKPVLTPMMEGANFLGVTPLCAAAVCEHERWGRTRVSSSVGPRAPHVTMMAGDLAPLSIPVSEYLINV